MADSTLLDIARSLPKAPPRGSGDGWTKADHDYVIPTAKEIEHEVQALVALGELEIPPRLSFPFGAPKKSLVAALGEIDPMDKVAERVTLHRLLRAKKVKVPDPISTVDLVRLAMASGCLGKENKKETP